MTVSVLFVCTANICRSPYMELWSRHAVGEGAEVRFASAGTQGYREQPMAPEMRPALSRHGIDVEGFRSRRLTGSMVDDADLVLTAERSHRAFLLDDHAHAFRKVLTLGQAAEAADRVPGGTHGYDGLVALARHRGAAEAEHDVADPYGRGAESAEACATTVSTMLARVLPVLTGRPVSTPETPHP